MPPGKIVSWVKKHHRKNAHTTFCIAEIPPMKINPQHLFVYLGFYVAFNTVQVISRRVV